MILLLILVLFFSRKLANQTTKFLAPFETSVNKTDKEYEAGENFHESEQVIC